MHTFLVYAVPSAPRCNQPPLGQPILACVATGSVDAAQGVVLGELQRAGWKVLEVVAPAVVRDGFPGLKHRPAVAQVMAAARQRGVAFLVLGSEDAGVGLFKV